MIRSTAYIQASVLWHLLEEGVATRAELVRLSGCSRSSISGALVDMRKLGCVLGQKVAPGQWTYRLTHAGVDAALQVQRSQVLFAEPVPAESAT